MRIQNTLLAFMLLWCPNCFPCSSGFVKLEKTHERADIIFYGIPIEAKLLSDKSPLFSRVGAVEVTFLVKEIFKGESKYNHIRIYTGMGGADCGVDITLLNQYVIAADLTEGKFYTTGISDGTQLWNSSIDEFLREKYMPVICPFKGFQKAKCK